jgi:hypothetical protein
MGERRIRAEAEAVEEIYLPGGGRGRFEVALQAVAVTEPSDILDVKVTPAKIVAKPGSEVTLNVEVVRRKDYDKPVTIDAILRHLGGVHASGLPTGVTVDAKSKTLLGTGSKGTIVLKIPANATPVKDVPICVMANVSINFVVKVHYASAVIPLSIEP